MFSKIKTSLRTQNLILLLIPLAFYLRIHRLAYQSFWEDEFITIGRIRIPFDSMIANLFEVRNHVPLYFTLMRGWGLLGDSEFVLRFFSVIWGVLSVALIYQFGKQIARRTVGLIAALLLTISPLHIWFSQEVRMYSLLPFLVLATNFLLWMAINRRKRRYWLGYTAVTLLALLTHYFAILILVAQYVFFSLNVRHLKAAFGKWFIASTVAGLPLAAWIFAIATSGGFAKAPIGWIPAARWFEPALTWLTLSVGSTINPRQVIYTIPALLFFASVVAARPIRRKPQPDSLYLASYFLLCWLLVPILLTWLISLDLPLAQKRAIYVDRYFVMTLPALLILVALGWQRWQEKWRQPFLIPTALAITIAITALSLNNLYNNPDYRRENWRSAIAYLEATWQPNDLLLLPEGSIMPYLYYHDIPLPTQYIPPLPADGSLTNDEIMAQVFSEIEGPVQRIWLLSGVNNGNPHGFPQERNQVVANAAAINRYRQWLDGRFPLLSEWQTTGVYLTLYAYQSQSPPP
ncbi:MAG: glycosyltransferase family 39 protein [Anaerolineae bacterium]